jgi:hypothetical protein
MDGMDRMDYGERDGEMAINTFTVHPVHRSALEEALLANESLVEIVNTANKSTRW